MTPKNALLCMNVSLPLRASNGGFFVSRGQGRHPERVINSFELIFVSEGVLELCEEGRDFAVRAGESLILWPGRRHYAPKAYPEQLAFYWLHFHLPGEDGSDAQPLSIPQHAKVSRPEHLTSLFRRFLDDQETLGSWALGSRDLAASLLVTLMLWEVAGSHPSPGRLESATTVLAGRANTLIRTQFHKPLSTTVLATQLRCNPDYLGRVFQQEYGCTPTEAIHQRRLKYARKLLLESSRTVEAVAYTCGFSDVGYFRRLFKRTEGMTPQKFRMLYAKAHVNTE